MLTSIRELLKQQGILVQNSVYRTCKDEVLDFKLTIGDFVESGLDDESHHIYEIFKIGVQIQQQLVRDSIKLKEIQQRKEELCRLLGKKREKKEKCLCEIPELSAEERRTLKEEKRKLEELEKEERDCLEALAEEILGYSWKQMSYLKYKRTVYLICLEEIVKRFPVLANVQQKNIPFFVSGLAALEEALAEKKEIGMVGGPCLYGMDEVLIHIRLTTGEEARFDSSCGRRCLMEGKDGLTLSEYLMLHREEIGDICYESRKTGITQQEYDSIRMLFQFAEKLNAKVVIPLPDLSYFKYMESDLKALPKEKKEQLLLEFQKEAFRITDYYLEVIECFKKQYPGVACCVLHYRNQEMMELFYRKRQRFIKDSSYMRKLTNVDGKKDVVVDYITMLALPYYIYGTEHIVQLDSVDETDSGRKCMKMHKGTITLTQILYPEYLSRDGKNTIYNTTIEYKDYLAKECWR